MGEERICFSNVCRFQVSLQVCPSSPRTSVESLLTPSLPSPGPAEQQSRSCWHRTKGGGKAVAVPACVAGLADSSSASSLVVCPSWGVSAPWAAPSLLALLLLVIWQHRQVVKLCLAASWGCQPLALGFPCAAGESRGLWGSAGQEPCTQVFTSAFSSLWAWRCCGCASGESCRGTCMAYFASHPAPRKWE